MQKLKNEEVVAMVVTSTREVFNTMLGLTLESGGAHQEPVHPATYDGVVALVGVAGPWIGTGRISCSPEFACRLAASLWMSGFETVNEEVMDAVAEIANMIIGNVKTLLEERVGSLALSIPTVIYGRSYKTRSAGVLEWTVVPFHCGGETLEVRFHLMEAPKMMHQMFRPEFLQV